MMRTQEQVTPSSTKTRPNGAVPKSRMMRRWLHASAQPVDGAFLAAFRLLFGLILAVSMSRFILYGWIERLLLAPDFRFKYWGFSWVEPLPDAAMHGLFWVLVALSILMALGLWHRLTAGLLAIGLTYIQLIDVSTYLNHYYLAALLCYLLAACPAARLWSLDARRNHRAGQPTTTTVPALCLWLLRFQVGIVYIGAGLAKLQPDWLLHAQPLRIWLGESAGLPVLGPLLQLPEAPLLMSWAGFIFDISVVFFLSVRKTRVYAFAAVVVFHGLTRLLFPIGMFPLIMTSAALCFFPPAWPRRLGRYLQLTSTATLSTAASPGSPRAIPLSSKHRWSCAAVAVYCALQAVLPLRYLAYGDNVLWHEQGMRFSWRVMVRAKGGSTEFEVKQLSTGEHFIVSPQAYLTPMQEMEMVGQPDLILQLAHHIHGDMTARGLGPVAVHALSSASLNGRRAVPLIDPETNLTQVDDGLARADWILPPPSDDPPQTRIVP